MFYPSFEFPGHHIIEQLQMRPSRPNFLNTHTNQSQGGSVCSGTGPGGCRYFPPLFPLGSTVEMCALCPKLMQCPGVTKPAEFQSLFLWPQDACEHKSSYLPSWKPGWGEGLFPSRHCLYEGCGGFWYLYHFSSRWEESVAPPLPSAQEMSCPPLNVTLAKKS